LTASHGALSAPDACLRIFSTDPRLIVTANMSPSSVSVARRDISITASITTVARNLGPNAPGSTPVGSSARVCVAQLSQQTFSS
jgi:hypothetical protein